MSPHKFHRILTVAAFVSGALLLGGGTVAQAGSPAAYVDNDLVRACASLSPCYTTIQAGVNNVGGPGEAQVIVFPGTYNESVNLNNMASAFNQIFGNLTLRSADATGNPSPGTVTIRETAPISTSIGFPNDVTIDGFVIQSTQKDGVFVSSMGSIAIRNSVASNPGGGSSPDGNDGFDLSTISGGSVIVEDSSADRAHGDLGDGFQIVTSGGATLRNVQANNNKGTQDNVGINMPDSEGDIVLDNVTANDNSEQGIYVYTTGTVNLSGETNNNSGFIGAQIYTDLGYGNPSSGAYSSTQQGAPAIAVSDFTAINNADDGLQVQAGGDITVADSRSDDNRGHGMSILAGKGVSVTNVHTEDNDNQGLYVEATTTAVLDRVSVINNGNGGNGQEGGIKVDGSSAKLGSLTIMDSYVRFNTGQGIDVFNLLAAGTHSISSNVICGNDGGLRNNGTILTLPAEGNWWGAATGPTSAQNPGGTGDSANAGGDGTIDFDPWITHVTAAGTSGIVFTFPDDAVTHFLNNGPGYGLGTSPFTIATDNGTLTAGNETGASVHPFINNSQLQATLNAAQQGDATVTLSGPCGLNGQVVVQIAAGTNRIWGNSDCSTDGIKARDGQALQKVILEQPLLGPPFSPGPGICPTVNTIVVVNGTPRTWGNWDCSTDGIKARDVQALQKVILEQPLLGPPFSPEAGDCPAVNSSVIVS